ncbi:hypothetical protein SEVIR_6G143000v4 [Setaria viridis]|uniref:Uncharacterized protein n=1 Tax=Setaria viridis TaxID=4556 RepID=A0A4U6U6Q2_SETVI|nr:hypothetical protein SEVIR_6G143000v2 [Setaria viridis]
MSGANVSHEHHRGQELSSEHESLSLSSSTEEPPTPELQLEIAKEVTSRLTMPQQKRMLSADEHSLIKSLEDRIPSLEAEVASGVGDGGATPSPPKVAPSGHAHAPAKASCAVAVSLSPVHTLQRPGPCAPLVHPLFHQVATPAAPVTNGRQVVTKDSGEEDAQATSGVQIKMSDANASHEHHRGQELSSEHESLFSSLSSSSEEPLTPMLQLEIAKELIRRFTMTQEKRMLSAGELSLIKFLEDRIPGLAATAALGACSGQHPLRRGFMVATPVRWAWLHRESIRWRAPPCHHPSREEPLTPEIQLEIASEVINRLAVAQERRMLSASELSLLKFLGDRIPDLEAAASGMHGGATPSPSKVVSSRSRARAKTRCHAAVLSSLLVDTLLEQVSTPAANVTAGRQVATRHLGEEDAHANSIVVDGSSSLPSSSIEEPLTPEIQLEIAKEVINQLVMAQEKRMLSADEHALIKFLEDRIPGLEAATGVRSGETQSLSKVASSCLARAKARRVITTILSSTADNLRCPGLCTPMVHPLSHQDAMPAAHVTVGQEVVIRHLGEEDAHATSAVHKMSDANFSHEHHRGGQELSCEHESFLEKRNSWCDLGVVTEKSSTTIAPEMAPPPSDGDNTAESSDVSSRWGTAPDAEGFNDFGLPDDLGLY